MSNIPDDLNYSKSHEWVLFEEDGAAQVGLTDYAQDALGDIVFINLPRGGGQRDRPGRPCATWSR